MIPIPDHPIGERFCRKCALFLPLANFFKGKRRRYECKAHSRGRPRKAPSKKRRLPSSEQAPKTSSPQRNKAVAQVWHAAYTDCRSSFGQATVGVCQGELRELFEALGAEASTAFRLVPIDPCKELATGNARMAALQNAAADDAGEVEGGQGQLGGLVRTEDSSEQQRGEVVGDAKEEQVEEGEGTDDEGDDDEDDDDSKRPLLGRVGKAAAGTVCAASPGILRRHLAPPLPAKPPPSCTGGPLQSGGRTSPLSLPLSSTTASRRASSSGEILLGCSRRSPQREGERPSPSTVVEVDAQLPPPPPACKPSAV